MQSGAANQEVSPEDSGPRKSDSRFNLKNLVRSPVGLIGTTIVILVLLMAVFAPLLSPNDPYDHDLTNRISPPMWNAEGQAQFPLGTDTMGRCLLSRIIYGSRVSVAVGVSAIIIAGLIGVTFGLIAGYLEGWYDTVISRFIDAFMAIPPLLLTMTIMAAIGHEHAGVLTLVVVLGFTRWVSYARLVRGEVFSLKKQEFIQAAQALGQNTFWILFKHLLPNVMASIVVIGTLGVGGTMLSEASLSFLGLGVQPPTITWGIMLSEGRTYISTSWWLATFPGIAITVTVLGVTFLGDWLRDVLDPRLKQ